MTTRCFGSTTMTTVRTQRMDYVITESISGGVRITCLMEGCYVGSAIGVHGDAHIDDLLGMALR